MAREGRVKGDQRRPRLLAAFFLTAGVALLRLTRFAAFRVVGFATFRAAGFAAVFRAGFDFAGFRTLTDFVAAAPLPRVAGVLAFDFDFDFDFAANLRAMAAPSSAGERTVVTLAASSAANLSAAVPLPPEITAPAWPMRLPGGAVTPAM